MTAREVQFCTVAKVTQEVSWRNYIARAAEGDQAALAALYDESSRLVYSVILMILRSPEDTEEVMLDVYAAVWNNARTFDPSRGSVAGWLVVLARSRAIDRFRSSAWRQNWGQKAELETLNVAAGGQSPETQALDSERYNQLRSALMTLGAEERELLLLAFFRGHSHRELAEQLQMPLGTVKTKIRNAMIKLRNRLSYRQSRAQANSATVVC